VTSSDSLSPQVSIVIATRNRRALLSEAVASVERQRGVLVELLVVDDASTDDTAAWLDARAGGTLRSFRLDEHSERAHARNLGLAHCRAPYVMFLDDDDVLRPDALAILVAALDRTSSAVAAVGARWDWFVGERWGRRDAHPRWPRARDVSEAVLFGWSAVSGQNLFRTELVRSLGGYDAATVSCEDRDLWLRLAPHGPVVLRPEVVMTYRMDGGPRPPEVLRARARVALAAVRRLPRPARRRALVVRRSAALIDRSEATLRDGRPIAAAVLTARALRLTPGLLLSPPVGPWVAHRLVRAAARRFWKTRAK